MAQTLIDFSGLFLKVYLNDGTNEYMRVRNTDFSMAAYTSPQVIYIKRQGNTICQVDGDVDSVRYGASSFADMLSQLETAIAAIPPEGGGGGGGNVVDTWAATLGAGNTTGGHDANITDGDDLIFLGASSSIIFPIDSSTKQNKITTGAYGINILADADPVLLFDNNLSQISSYYIILARSNVAVGTPSATNGQVGFKNSIDNSEVQITSAAAKSLTIDNTGHDVAAKVFGSFETSAGLTVGTEVQTKAQTISTNTTLDGTMHTILIDTGAGPVDLTLPAAAGNTREYYITADDLSDVARVLGLVSGTYTFATQTESIIVQSDGTNWRIYGQYLGI